MYCFTCLSGLFAPFLLRQVLRRSASCRTLYIVNTFCGDNTLLCPRAAMQQCFIFFGTMLRSLAAPALNTTAAWSVSSSEASKGADRAAETEHSGIISPHDEGRAPLSVLDPVAGLILDSAPSRLTPDIAARRVNLPADIITRDGRA